MSYGVFLFSDQALLYESRTLFPDISFIFRRFYQWHAEVVNIHHGWRSVPRSVLFIVQVSFCIGDSFALQIMRCEPVLLLYDTDFNCITYEALPCAVVSTLSKRISIFGI